MIIGICNFSYFNAQVPSNTESVISNVQTSANMSFPAVNGVRARVSYATTSRAMGLSPSAYINGQIAAIAGARMNILQPLVGVIKDVGDVFTMGCRVSGMSNAEVMRLAAFWDGDESTTEVTSYTAESGYSNPYVEVSVSKQSENLYRYVIRVNSVVKLDTTLPTLLGNVGIGVNGAWRSPAVSSQKYISLSDLYWSFNKEGVEEFIGSCSVRVAGTTMSPNTVPSLASRINIPRNDGSVAPNELTEPVATRLSSTIPTTMDVKAVSYRAFAASSSLGQVATLKTSIVDGSGVEVKSSHIDVTQTAPYVPTDAVCIETTSAEFPNLTFVADNKR